MSAYYLTGYLSLAIPAVLAGLAATRSGLTHTHVIFGAVVAITCGAAGWLGSRLAAERHRSITRAAKSASRADGEPGPARGTPPAARRRRK